jgi:uncharacterized protein
LEGRITPQTNLYQLLADFPLLIPLFIKKRLACVGCTMSRFETLADLTVNYNLDLSILLAEITSTLKTKIGDPLIETSYFILYVSDQQRSTDFYERVLGTGPRTNVPEMTEFELGSNCILGLMPLSGVSQLFDKAGSKGSAQNLRAEIYLLVDDPLTFHKRSIAAGAHELSAFAVRDWGHKVAYSVDFDGNVIAFAQQISDHLLFALKKRPS